jgi:hypothetical protein
MPSVQFSAMVGCAAFSPQITVSRLVVSLAFSASSSTVPPYRMVCTSTAHASNRSAATESETGGGGHTCGADQSRQAGLQAQSQPAAMVHGRRCQHSPPPAARSPSARCPRLRRRWSGARPPSLLPATVPRPPMTRRGRQRPGPRQWRASVSQSVRERERERERERDVCLSVSSHLLPHQHHLRDLRRVREVRELEGLDQHAGHEHLRRPRRRWRARAGGMG